MVFNGRSALAIGIFSSRGSGFARQSPWTVAGECGRRLSARVQEETAPCLCPSIRLHRQATCSRSPSYQPSVFSLRYPSPGIFLRVSFSGYPSPGILLQVSYYRYHTPDILHRCPSAGLLCRYPAAHVPATLLTASVTAASSQATCSQCVRQPSHCLLAAFSLPSRCLLTAFSLPSHCLLTAFSLPSRC